ncbi:SH2 domain-containing protein 4B-like isoform X2 [Sycon ciliatum]|uniref:SH2 domain-containing protein 4B-like isoform X2 n=1 Tax=Sycon ciliatum TaxID=27933 RepID=UPI0020AB6C06|eukprot:scpid33722/ scgid10965/ SH2 domain-containing protein 4A
MLQQILKDMFIEPELLEELTEEQKQILFMKMREEQVRRYDVWLEEPDGAPAKKTTNKPPRKVEILLDSKEQPWTWVLGEADEDVPYDTMVTKALKLEEEEQKQKDEEDARKAQELAMKQAEEKAEAARKEREARRVRLLSEEEERIKREHDAFAAELRQKEAEMIYATAKEARLAAQRSEEEKARRREEQEQLLQRRAREQEEKDRREEQLERERLEKEAARKSQEIYVNMRQLRIQQEASEREVVEAEWRKQTERAKEYETERRRSMQRAKEVKQTSNGQLMKRMRELSTPPAVVLLDTKSTQGHTPPPLSRSPRPGNTATLPPVPSGPRPGLGPPSGSLPRQTKRAARPANKAEVIQWFRDVEWSRRIVCDKSGRVCPWFHGILTRAHAEQLLDGKPPGTFLIRVSERIWGYTVSVASTYKCKHFLVDAAAVGKYQFFGDNQKVHDDLHSLIEFHQKYPISVAGQELLMTPQAQVGRVPDYQELVQ